MKTAIVTFNGGEYSPKIDARADTEKYAGGCRILENMIPSIFGGAEKRPGTEFILSSAMFNTILSAIVAYENEVVCDSDEVIVLDFNTMLSKIICYGFDVICYENEVVSETNMAFLRRALCYENNLVFYDNEVVYI